MRTSLERVLILGICAFCITDIVQGIKLPFTLSIEAEQSAAKAGSEVRVDVTLRNSSNRAVFVSMGATETDYAIEVRDSEGRPSSDTDFARKLKQNGYYSNDTVFNLQPGQSLPRTPLSLRKLYDLSRPGKYVVQVSRTVPKELGGGTAKSNTITVTITE